MLINSHHCSNTKGRSTCASRRSCMAKQDGIIANQELVKHMAPFGYHPVQHKIGLWVHDSRKTIFSLVVDALCVQYFSTEDANHFFKALRSKYLIIVDMAATVYIGIKLEWDYMHRTITLSMPSYVSKALHGFQHILRGFKVLNSYFKNVGIILMNHS